MQRETLHRFKHNQAGAEIDPSEEFGSRVSPKYMLSIFTSTALLGMQFCFWTQHYILCGKTIISAEGFLKWGVRGEEGESTGALFKLHNVSNIVFRPVKSFH